MAPYGAKRTNLISQTRTRSNDSSVSSSFFKEMKSMDGSSSGSLQSMNFEEETFSVQTPSVNDDSESFSLQSFDNDENDGETKKVYEKSGTSIYETSNGETTLSFDITSVDTPSVTSDAPSVDLASINTPSVQSRYVASPGADIQSIQTPSIQDEFQFEDEMDQSTFGSVIDSVIHSIIGKGRERTPLQETIQEEENFPQYGESEKYVQAQMDQNVEEKYDEFMNELATQSVDIMRKRSTALADVMSTMQQESDDSNDDDLIKFQNYNGVANPNKIEGDYEYNNYKTIPGTLPEMTSRSQVRRAFNDGGLQNKDDDASIGSSMDLSQASVDDKVPTNMTKNRFAKRSAGNGNVHKNDIDQRREIEFLLSLKKYAEMLEMIHGNPKILAVQSSQPSGKTFLHVIASMPIPPPENIILKVVSVDTSLVTVTDNNLNSPLHYAAQHVRKGNMHAFTVLLKFHPMGAIERNSDGDLPLHIVASNPARGAEEAAHLLLETNPKAISEPNNKGKIPLHLALSEGSKNLKLLMKIIKLHKFRKSSVDIVDNKGNTPLHCAILNGTKYDAVNLFNKEIHDSNLSAYMKENENGYVPLHLALNTAKVDPLIIISLIKAAPFSAGMPTPGGDMPVAIATKANMKPEIVKLLLASDMPIELGNKNGKAGMGAIVEREHGHSWWHVAVECQSRYVDVITSLLSDHATFVQIIALARCLGPDGKTITIDVISSPLEAGLRNLLRFYHRYELSMTRMPVCSNEIQSFAAKDHGEELEKKKVTGPWLNSGFTTIKEDDRKMKADNSSCEITYVPWDRKSNDVTLRCYAFDDSFDSEKKYRDQHNISPTYFEEIITVHTVTNYINASFTSGKLLCIAYEKSDLTLNELLGNETVTQHRNWLVKCHLILKDVGMCLQHLHNESLIHGNLDTTTIGQFQSKWKLMYIGQAVKMGNAMGGSLRRCVPPEALSGTKPASNFKPKTDKGKSLTDKNRKSRSISASRSRLSTTLPSSAMTTGTLRGKNINLPPLPQKNQGKRKKFGIFVFGLKDLGLGAYGNSNSGRSRSKSRGTGGQSGRGTSIGERSADSSVDSRFNSAYDLSETDEGSLRIIEMQEDEIARLRQALEEKENLYRRQLIEERAAFKREEIERQRELQKTRANMLSKAKESLYRFAPEKVMASPTWDIWSFGLLMTQLILGQTPLLPCFAGSDDEFIEQLMLFQETQVAAICEEVREYAGDLAADLVARLLHPRPEQRIESISKVLQHRYFHEEVVESKKNFKRGRKNTNSKKKKNGKSGSDSKSFVNSYKDDRGTSGTRSFTRSSVGGTKSKNGRRSLSRKRVMRR